MTAKMLYCKYALHRSGRPWSITQDRGSGTKYKRIVQSQARATYYIELLSYVQGKSNARSGRMEGTEQTVRLQRSRAYRASHMAAGGLDSWAKLDELAGRLSKERPNLKPN